MTRLEHIMSGFAVLAVIAVFSLIIGAVIHEANHPCLAHGPKEECMGFHHVGDVLVPYWYDCTPCLERKP